MRYELTGFEWAAIRSLSTSKETGAERSVVSAETGQPADRGQTLIEVP
jgi:hypothetical protein